MRCVLFFCPKAIDERILNLAAESFPLRSEIGLLSANPNFFALSIADEKSSVAILSESKLCGCKFLGYELAYLRVKYTLRDVHLLVPLVTGLLRDITLPGYGS